MIGKEQLMAGVMGFSPSNDLFLLLTSNTLHIPEHKRSKTQHIYSGIAPLVLDLNKAALGISRSSMRCKSCGKNRKRNYHPEATYAIYDVRCVKMG